MKRVNILIGQKGSGKTHIGQLLQDKLNIPFLRVEDICLKIKANREITDEEYIREAFEQIEKEIRRQLQKKDQLTIESTGAVYAFDKMLYNLRKDFNVRLVKVDADPQLCLQRVKIRDTKIHIPVSDDMVIEINRLAAKKIFDFDLIITNNNKSDNEILDEWNKTN